MTICDGCLRTPYNVFLCIYVAPWAPTGVRGEGVDVPYMIAQRHHTFGQQDHGDAGVELFYHQQDLHPHIIR